MVIRGVLLVGRFRTHIELNGMPAGEQRNALIVELSKHSNLPVEHYQALDDTALAGKGAVMVFIREAKFRNDAELLSMSDGDQRNCVIVELNIQTGLPIPQLQTMSDLDLVSVGLGRFNSFIRGVLLVGRFRTHAELNGMPAGEQRNALIVELSKHSNLPVEHYQALDDTALAGKGAVMVFIREAKFRTDAELLSMSDGDQRNCAIVELNIQTGLPVTQLQTRTDVELCLSALGAIDYKLSPSYTLSVLGTTLRLTNVQTQQVTEVKTTNEKITPQQQKDLVEQIQKQLKEYFEKNKGEILDGSLKAEYVVGSVYAIVAGCVAVVLSPILAEVIVPLATQQGKFYGAIIDDIFAVIKGESNESVVKFAATMGTVYFATYSGAISVIALAGGDGWSVMKQLGGALGGAIEDVVSKVVSIAGDALGGIGGALKDAGEWVANGLGISRSKLQLLQ